MTTPIIFCLASENERYLILNWLNDNKKVQTEGDLIATSFVNYNFELLNKVIETIFEVIKQNVASLFS